MDEKLERGVPFDFIYPQNPQIGLPAMKLEQRVMIGTEISRYSLPTNGFIEHSAECGSVDVAALNGESNNATGELIHHHQHPVALQYNGLASKEIDTPQTVLHVSDE